MLVSSLCKQSDLESEDFLYWTRLWSNENKMHRKNWEWAFILQALNERNLLQEGKTGLGFAVGKEPISSIAANHRCKILATDLPSDNDSVKDWSGSMWASNLESLYCPSFCDKDIFVNHVSFRPVDMTEIPNDIGQFDFMWSSCALEHLGSLRKGIDFICNSLEYLKKGGVAVHTTEYNISSNEQTTKKGLSVIYRKKDIELLSLLLEDIGCKIVDIDYNSGNKDADFIVDKHPYTGLPHLKLEIDGFVCTSLGLIIEKAR